MLYQPFIPFVLPRKRARSGRRVLDFSAEAIREFWVEANDEHPDLSRAKGCYIFGIRAGKGIRPWYVGQTRRAFSRECFQPHKRSLYMEACQHNKSGTPLLFLLARTTAGGRIATGGPSQNELDFLEQMLIGIALSQNKNLLNKRATRFMRDLQVPGILNSDRGPGTAAVRSLRVVLGQT